MIALLTAPVAGCVALFDFASYDPTAASSTPGTVDAAAVAVSVEELTAEPAEITVTAGGRASLGVRVIRTPGSVPVGVDVEGLPSGVTPETAPLDVPGGTRDRALVLVAAPDVVPGTYQVRLRTRTEPTKTASFELRVRGATGELDRSFGDEGIADLGLSSTDVRTLVVLPDRRVYAGVVDGNDVLVVRVNADGRVDATFGAGGVARVPSISSTRIVGLSVDPDGSAVVAGGAGFATIGGRGDDVVVRAPLATGERAVFARRRPDGYLLVVDTADGRVLRRHLDAALVLVSEDTLATGRRVERVRELRSSSSLVLGLGTTAGGANGCFAMLVTEGVAPSPAIVVGACSTTDVDGSPDGRSLALGGVVGARGVAELEATLARRTFPADGAEITYLGATSFRTLAVGVDGAGRTTVASPSFSGGGVTAGGPFVARFLRGGGRDPSFAGSTFSQLRSFAPGAVAVGPDDAVVVGGRITKDAGASLALVRISP